MSRPVFGVSDRGARPDELSEADRQNLREVFDVFDSDKDTRIDFHELKCAMKALGFDPAKAEVLEIIKKHDRVAQRYIGYNDFEREMRVRLAQRDPLDEVRKAFYLFSPDGQGITFEQLKQVALDIGEVISDQELRAMIDEFDLDDDGRISLDEFIRICTK